MVGHRGSDLLHRADPRVRRGEHLGRVAVKPPGNLECRTLGVIGDFHHLDERFASRGVDPARGSLLDEIDLSVDARAVPAHLVHVSVRQSASQPAQPHDVRVRPGPAKYGGVAAPEREGHPVLDRTRGSEPGLTGPYLGANDGDRLACQERAAGLGHSLETPDTPRDVGPFRTEHVPLSRGVAGAQCQTRASVGDQVQGGDVRREQQRFADARLGDVGANSDALGDRRGGDQRDEGEAVVPGWSAASSASYPCWLTLKMPTGPALKVPITENKIAPLGWSQWGDCGRGVAVVDKVPRLNQSNFMPKYGSGSPV